jgi:hypothetical protein
MNQYILINNIIDSWHETRGMGIIDDELFLCQIHDDIVAITHSAQRNIQLSMTKGRCSDVEKHFGQCLRLTFVVSWHMPDAMGIAILLADMTFHMVI